MNLLLSVSKIMLRRRLLAFACLLIAPLLMQQANASVTLDFNTLQHGEIVTNQFSNGIDGVTISGINLNKNFDLVVAFDTYAHPTEDPDLEDPFGPGNASRDPDGTLGLLDPSIPDPWGISYVSRFHKALIIQENDDGIDDGIADFPDDEGRRPAGSIFFDFDNPITEVGFDLLDIEGPKEYRGSSGYVASFFVNNQELARVGFAEFITPGSRFYDSTVKYGNNSANRIQPITVEKLSAFTGTIIEKFDRVEINFGGSAAVDNLVYTAFTSPTQAVPEASSVLIWALLGLAAGGYRSRQFTARPQTD